ncbi:2Fe-2S iron-sulfur cluster-binding protein [Pseudomaricurvus sp. HS19]|uniref:2Fe-2S iron-sulfur cluster-binding protein n=1 Tax=Pseudomaricurvus sp. HS19 TaxID=2692626 RepID=UPI00136BFF15|nr:2Fe-2S iron-sulfur cluster-binding protein [Pseudomaricurvus sp. HS19]MYM65105.1 2Fe-2S iron-sulfur cluster binding domain-containing protein [Pseudomaricurvus sp. HS19]
MKELVYDGEAYDCRKGETALQVLLRHGVDVNYSCKKGVCNACMCKATQPAAALFTGSLPQDLIDSGYFLPCRTTPYTGLSFGPVQSGETTATAAVTEKTRQAPLAGEQDMGDERPWPSPCESLWRRLQADGDLLKEIIDDFYDAVFEDDIMAPYFQKFTKQRSKEKVYSFYKQLFSGEKCYFGDRPRNAHHWMVIPNEVYDHRLRLLLGFMRKHGLSEEMIALWLPYEEYYRTDIVKTSPRGRKVGDIYQPAGGFDYEILDEGSVCDSCEEFVDKGTRVMFHLRTGQIYCPACHDKAAVVEA